MRRTIYIQFDAITYHGQMPAQVSWVVQGMNSPVGLVFRGNLRTAANHALGCRVIIFLSGIDMLLTSVSLPAMNKQRLLKAIPYSLEEQLASDVEQLHFAVGERLEESAVPCCVIERDILVLLQQRLKEVGMQADVITSELFAIPNDADSWTVWVNHSATDKTLSLVRSGVQSGAAIDIDNISVLLHNNLDAIDEEQRPSTLHFYTSQDKTNVVNPSEEETDLLDLAKNDEIEAAIDEEGEIDSVVAIASIELDDVEVEIPTAELGLELQQQLNKSCAELGLKFEPIICDEPYLAALAKNFNESNSINLLQGEFSRKEQFEKFLRPWRSAAIVAACWLLLQLGLMIGEYIQLSNKDKVLKTAITNVYKQTFPNSKNLVNPKVQMQRKLEKLRGGGGPSGGFLSILSKVGKILKDTPSMSLHSVRYKDNKLNLDLQIADLQALDKLKIRLVKESKLEVDIVSASARDGKVESRLKIRLMTN